MENIIINILTDVFNYIVTSCLHFAIRSKTLFGLFKLQLKFYIAPLRSSRPKSVLPQAIKIVFKCSKKGKRKHEKLKTQLLRKIVPARGPHKSEASGLSSSTAQKGNNQKASGRKSGG